MNKLKTIILIPLLGLIITNGFSQEDSTIREIKTNFQKWHPIIDNEIEICPKFFNYAWGENYQFDKWYNKNQNIDGLNLAEAVSIIERKDLGYFVRAENPSFSGDWHIVTDYYFNKEQQLSFIYWRMNTFQAEEPLTIEKRLYFNLNGEIIRNINSVFKMNTKEPIEINFMDREVVYKLTLREMDFYKYWKNEN